MSDEDRYQEELYQREEYEREEAKKAAMEQYAHDDYRLSLVAEIDDSRLCELAEAERDERVVVLPCKVGDKAYWITHFGKMKASGIVVDILIRARDVLVGIDTENGSGMRKSIKDILYFQEAEADRALAEKGDAT